MDVTNNKNEKNIKDLEIIEHIKLRPAMYIGGTGSKGIINVLKKIIEECISVCRTDDIFFSIRIDITSRFEIIIKSNVNILPFLEKNLSKSFENNIYYYQILEYLTSFLQIEKSEHKATILFDLDEDIIKNLNVDYQELNEQLLETSLLNRNSKILLIDERNEYNNQNFHSYPQGLFYRYNRILNDVIGKPEFEILFDGKINDLDYQIALSYRTDWYPNPTIESYANNVKTTCGGSLVDGIFKGMIKGCKKYVKSNSLNEYNIKKKKFYNGLIIVCSVKGKDFIYDGSFKEALNDKIVKKDIETLIERLTFDFLEENNKKAKKFLYRFDESQLTSEMYE